jgi:MAF protein
MQINQVILATSSPRRRELFALTGISPGHLSVEIDERPQPGEDPGELVTRLATEKSRTAAQRIGAPNLVIAADTIVINGSRILGKPEDPVEARRILLELAGRSHRVLTALTIVDTESGRAVQDLCETAVPMREYSLDEINQYIATGSPMDKAGAYGIQDEDFNPVEIEHMHGCYANVMGLPLCHLTRSIKGFGLEPITNVPEACRVYTKYPCAVHAEILNFQR